MAGEGSSSALTAQGILDDLRGLGADDVVLQRAGVIGSALAAPRADAGAGADADAEGAAARAAVFGDAEKMLAAERAVQARLAGSSVEKEIRQHRSHPRPRTRTCTAPPPRTHAQPSAPIALLGFRGKGRAREPVVSDPAGAPCHTR